MFPTVPIRKASGQSHVSISAGGFRRQGMTPQLIKAAIDYAEDNDAKIVEAYPVDYDSPSYSYMGRIGTFERLGFKEIAMAGIRRHIMRLQL